LVQEEQEAEIEKQSSTKARHKPEVQYSHEKSMDGSGWKEGKKHEVGCTCKTFQRNAIIKQETLALCFA